MWVKATDHQQSLNPSVLVYLFISSICLHKSHAMGEWEWYSFCLRAKDEEGKGVSDVLKGVSSPLVYFILGPKSKPKYNCPNQLLNNCSISIQTHWMFLWTFIKKHLFLNYIGCLTVINSSATWKHLPGCFMALHFLARMTKLGAKPAFTCGPVSTNRSPV